VASSLPQLHRREASLARRRCDALTALRLLVEAVCDDVVELTPESDALERIQELVTRLNELVDAQGSGIVSGRLVETSQLAS